MKSMNVQPNETERGNALLGIVVIIIVLLVGGVFFWNNYQIQERKNEDAQKQANTTQTIVEQPIIEAATSTATSTSGILQLDSSSNAKIIQISTGQDFQITLGNPGDGGYTFNAPDYDTSLLHLDNHSRATATSGAMGDFGTDTWQFTTLKTGATDITITATRAGTPKDTVNIYKASVSIK